MILSRNEFDCHARWMREDVEARAPIQFVAEALRVLRGAKR
jgi:hypothetical protein